MTGFGIVRPHRPLQIEGFERLTPDETTPLQIFWTGRIDNGDELRRLFNTSVAEAESAAAIMRQMIALRADRAFTYLKGDFVFVLWHQAERRLELIRDRVGGKAIYFHSNGSEFAFATKIKPIFALTGQSPVPDEIGLAGHLASGAIDQFNYGRTCFKNVSALPPSHTLTWHQGSSPQVKRYWDFTYRNDLEKITFQDACGEFRRLFDQAVARRSRGSTAVSVSGGLDSSAILCSLLSTNSPTTLFPISYFSSRLEVDETKFLKEIELKYKRTIHRLNMDSLGGIHETLGEQVFVSEAPFVDYQWKVTAALLNWSRQQGASTLLTGHFGDQLLFNWSYLTDLINHGHFRMARQHLREYSNWYEEDISGLAARQLPKQLLRSWVPRTWIPTLRRFWKMKRSSPKTPYNFQDTSEIANDAGLFDPDRFPTAQSRAMYAQIRSRYHIQCLDWYGKVSEHFCVSVAFPMFDVDLLDFLFLLPGHLQNYGGIPRAILREAMKDALPEAIKNRTWKADFSNVVNDAVQSEWPLLAKEIGTNSLISQLGYVNRANLDRQLKPESTLSATDCTTAWNLVDLAAFEIWLREFFNESPLVHRRIHHEKDQEEAI